MIEPRHNQAFPDSQYNNRLHVPYFQEYLDQWEKRSRETEKALPVMKNIPYGDLPRERLDIFPSPQPQAKTLIFIHGGYWQMLDKTLFHFLANSFREKGITTVFVTYPFAPDYSINQVVLSCRTALAWLYNNISASGGDPRQLYVAGHSAGGHLAAMLAATDWSYFHPALPADVLKGACFVSGLFDLVPIQLSYLNAVLGMDRDTAVRNSPVHLEPLTNCPLVVAVGQEETTAFREQSEGLYTGWNVKSEIQLLKLPGLNHYSIVDAIAEPKGALQAAISGLMGV